MNAIGGRMSVLMIAVVVVSVVGAAGTSLYYQERMEEAKDEVQERGERIDALEARLDETNRTLKNTRRELRDAKLELKELRGIEQRVEALEGRNENLRNLLTGQVAGAQEAARKLREAKRSLEEAEERNENLRNRLEGATDEYGRLLRDYETVYGGCEGSDGCFVPSDTMRPANYSSPDGF